MINFNGHDLSEKIRVTDVVRPVLPPSLVTSSSILGRPGDYFYHKQPGAYTIPVKFMLIEKEQKVLRQKVRELAELLDTDEPAPIVFNDEPDKFINAIIDGNTDLDEVAAVGSGTLEFYCPDPYWYAIEDDIIEKTAPGVYEFERKGTAESYPLIEIKGDIGNGSISIENRDSIMTYTGHLGEGETLYLDTDLITAYVIDSSGNTTSVIDKLDNLDFPVLKKGTNFLSVIANAGAVVSNVKVTCRSRWK